MVGQAIIQAAPYKEILVADRDQLDLRSSEEVDYFFKEMKPEAVILAAAKVGGIHANSQHQKEFLLENLQIQNSVISAALKYHVKDFVFLASSCIYPKFSEQPIKESALLQGPLEPTNEGYALAKIAGVRLCRAIAEQDGLNYFSLMPTNLYGPHDNFDLESSHVPAALIRRFHEAKIAGVDSVDVWGTGKARREFMHVSDLARACWFLINKSLGGELLNVGTGHDIEIREFAKLISDIVGFDGAIIYDETKPDGSPRKLLDVSKIEGLGWKHKVELATGLQDTYRWFIQALDKGEVRGY